MGAGAWFTEGETTASTGRRSVILLLAVAVLFCSCAGSKTRTYVHPEVDFPAYRRAAVLPFKNLTDEDYAGDRVTNIFVTEFLIASRMEIIEPNLTLSTLAEMGETFRPANREPAGLALETMRELGEVLDAQAVLIGSVDDYGQVRVGTETFPVVALSVRLLDAETGTVIWRASEQARGGPSVPFVGASESYTQTELAQKVCRKIVESMEKEIRWSTKRAP